MTREFAGLGARLFQSTCKMPVGSTAKIVVREPQMTNRIRLVPGILLLFGILIFCPALLFAQSRAVRLNENAFAYAKELIAEGRVVIDKNNAWRDHRPMAEEENEFVRTHGFAEYGKWHLGIDGTHAEGTKARYKFPFGDFKDIHRCALLAVRNRARQYDYPDIENAAIRLTELIHSRKKVIAPAERRRSVCAVSRVTLRSKKTNRSVGTASRNL
jgi:hypothetical protein